ncbi:response regulator transcription factor (plasmid) [Acinetobacter schindleri]|nr:response regulator transcription factor [Acinetobacter schindleri]
MAFIIAFKQNPLTRNVPLIFVTSTFNDQIFVDYLQAGADDYVIKPCLNYVLGVRIRFALLQLDKFLTSNHSIAHHDQAKIPKLKFDSSQRTLLLDKEGKVVSIELCPIGYKLLYFLAQHPDRPISRITLKNHLCGENDRIDDRSIDVYIRRIRLVLSKNKIEEIIRTVRGLVIVSIPH